MVRVVGREGKWGSWYGGRVSGVGREGKWGRVLGRVRGRLLWREGLWGRVVGREGKWGRVVGRETGGGW